MLEVLNLDVSRFVLGANKVACYNAPVGNIAEGALSVVRVKHAEVGRAAASGHGALHGSLHEGTQLPVDRRELRGRQAHVRVGSAMSAEIAAYGNSLRSAVRWLQRHWRRVNHLSALN